MSYISPMEPLWIPYGAPVDCLSSANLTEVATGSNDLGLPTLSALALLDSLRACELPSCFNNLAC